jgi:ribokinase
VTARVVVAGQLARDLVLRVGRMPGTGEAADVALRREVLGGKGANQAVALAQLGAPVALVAVAGGDDVGDHLVAQAARDGIDVTGVARRDGEPSALIVEVLEAGGGWRYLQHIPPGTLLTPADVRKADALFEGAAAVLVQLQQPPRAALAAARRGRDAGALVVLDGVPAEEDRAALLDAADVLRADEQETRLLTGVSPDDHAGVLAAAGKIDGLRLMALGVAGGNLFVWPEGHLLLPLGDEPVVDTTGAGDALTAALTVSHPGGRPDLRSLRPTG